MNTYNKLKAYLTERGMSDEQAESVMKDFVPAMNREAGEYHITWDRPASEYPDIMFSLWIKQLQVYALNWLNENKPQAWFKPMFMNAKDREDLLKQTQL